MTIEKKLENGTLTLAVAGRLDTNTAPDLEAALKLDGVSDITFDFAELDYISSAGLRILLTAQKAMMACGGKMTIAHANEMVRGVFQITGLDSVFTLVP
ncbi:MAG: STAS domain-containing protein [Kiritimatiellae bacterium]|nr:STAS domain-containing protein [Kiritimatiellia bacterium]